MLDMSASDRRPTLGGRESRTCELQTSNWQPSFKSDKTEQRKSDLHATVAPREAEDQEDSSQVVCS